METKKTTKLYKLVVSNSYYGASGTQSIIQYSFNKEDLEKIAFCLNDNVAWDDTKIFSVEEVIEFDETFYENKMKENLN